MDSEIQSLLRRVASDWVLVPRKYLEGEIELRARKCMQRSKHLATSLMMGIWEVDDEFHKQVHREIVALDNEIELLMKWLDGEPTPI